MRVSGKNPNKCYVAWSFTSKCNQACWYCPEFLHDGKIPFPDFDDAILVIDTVHEKHEDVFVNISGGETTMWPKLPQFLRTVSKKYPKIVIEIDTNGSRTRNWWKRFSQLGLQKNVVLNMCHHAAQCDPELFYDNVKTVSEAGFAVTANYMLDPDYFESSRAVYEKTKRLNVYTCMKVLRRNFDGTELIDGYTDEMLECIVESHKEFAADYYDPNVDWDLRIFYDGVPVSFQEKIIKHENSFLFWSCSAGNKRLIIDMDGTVWPCMEIAKTRNKKYYLGNIFERNVKLLDDHIVCPAQYCGCLHDALAEKYE